MKYSIFFFLIIIYLQIETVSAFNNSEIIEVTLNWSNNQGVIVEIEDQSFPMRASQQRVVQLPHSEALKVQIVTPTVTYEAEEFLILDESENNIVQLYMENGSVKIVYDDQLKEISNEIQIAAGNNGDDEASAIEDLLDHQHVQTGRMPI